MLQITLREPALILLGPGGCKRGLLVFAHVTTIPKLNSNKFDPLTDLDILDSDSASDDDSYNEYEKVSFNDQLRTVQLQRKVQFLQKN